MKTYMGWIITGVAAAALVSAQDAPTGAQQHYTMQFRDPAAPKKLEVTLMTAAANVTVRGVQRNDAEIEVTGGNFRGPRRASDPPPGMHRIGGSGSLDVTQDNNTVRVSGSRMFGGLGDIDIQVPTQTSVTISMTLNGKVVVENIAGEIEVNHLNGDVTITNASGPVVAHSTNGKIVASFNKVAPGKAMSFSTFNGEIDVTLPADAKATLKARADNGDIFTDFDVKLQPQSGAAAPALAALPAPPAPPEPPSANETREQVRERLRAAAESARQSARQAARQIGFGYGYVEGSINGGGTEMQFTTFNGRILIHKK